MCAGPDIFGYARCSVCIVLSPIFKEKSKLRGHLVCKRTKNALIKIHFSYMKVLTL